MFQINTEIPEFLGGAISFLCGGARAQSKFSTKNSPFSYQNYGKIILGSKIVIFGLKSNFRWKLNHSFDGDPLNGSQILKNFSKFFLDSLKFLGFSSSLIFGPLEKYKVGEAYR